MTSHTDDLKHDIYALQLQLNRLEEELHLLEEPSQLTTLLAAISEKRHELATLQQQLDQIAGSQTRAPILALQSHDKPATTRDGAPRDGATHGGGTRGGAHNGTRGIDTTGLDVVVELKMEHIPTAIYHLLDPGEEPLVECRIKNHSSETRRLRFTSYIEGYSAQAVDTLEIPREMEATFRQAPTLFPDRLHRLTELTRATLNVLVEDLDEQQVEIHQTSPLWLLARNSAPLYVRDPSTNGWNDLTRYLGAYVTPNAPAVMHFLRTVADHHPQKQLFGYQEGQDVLTQVRAIFTALQAAQLTYVNSTVTFNPEESARSQRVRLPREALEERQANCIDGTLLFASLLEAASLNPALVIIPRHALVAWETGKKNDQWRYIETTKLAGGTFEDALELGEKKAQTYRAVPTPMSFQQWSLRDLRTTHRITPLE